MKGYHVISRDGISITTGNGHTIAYTDDRKREVGD